MDEKPNPRLATGWRRVVFVCLGMMFVGLGYLGVLLPGLPATPFLMIASFFFVRSSPRLHRWLHRSPVFGRLLRDWETHRGIRKPAKIVAICMVVTAVTCSIIFSGLPIWAKCLIAGLALVGITTILMVPTVNDETPRAH
ncbi:MAG: YbaN family protein [Planctomycetes bacterium]|nr:YbaN family protein [Planctomycetota bacterium]